MATSSKKGTKVGDTVGGQKVTGTRKGVATRFAGQANDNSDGPSRGSNPQVNAINEARFANVEKGRDAYRGEAAAKGQIPEPVVETPLQANPAIPAQVANNIPPPSVPGSPTAPIDTGATTPNRFQAAHAQLSAGGATPTGNPGQNMAAVFGATPAAPPESTVVDQVFSEDPMINSIMQSATEFLSAESQKTTLMQDYKKLYKESGLKDINEELIDAETILDGTEDDIRNEIQTAGGFGTESQVQAMTLSRNKGLLKRYNQLFAAKQDAQQNLNTMMTINQQDRQMAQDRVNKQIDVAFKLADFRQQATNATKESYRWMISTLGADGVYNAYKADPKQMGNLERVLGLPSGGLQSAAAQAANQRSAETYMRSLQIKKAEQDVGIGLPETPEGEIPASIMNSASEGERKGLGFLNRAKNASETLSSLEGEGFDFGASKAANDRLDLPVIGGALAGLKSDKYKSYDQAAGDWIKAVLRTESGATIPPDEEAAYYKTYFPTFGDSLARREQKAKARAEAEDFLGTISGRLAPYADTGSFDPGSFYE